MISGVSRVVLSVDDQEKAKAFWTDRVGFEVAYDETYGGERWVEVRPPNGSPLLVLAARSEAERGPDVPDAVPHSDVFFTCDDIQETFEELTARGVVFHTPPVELHFGWWAMFEDHEGMRYALSVTSRDRT